MQITYLGHAGFLVETAEVVLVMDPWMSPEGAFDSGWFQFPCNHHLGGVVREKLEKSSKHKFIYVSHEHQDHYDLRYLKSLPNEGLTYVVPHFQRGVLREELGKLNPMGLISRQHGESVAIPGGCVKLYLDDAGLNRDSAILVKIEGLIFLNLNDCKLFDEVEAIRKSEGPIAVMACQFSGATWHPTCYDYSREEYERISRHKRNSKFEMVARALDVVKPGTYLPSAGPACFLDPTLQHLNFEKTNIFPRAAQFLEYLRRRLPENPTRCLDIMPGDRVSAEDGSFAGKVAERVSEANYEEYMRGYVERYAGYFAERQPRHSESQITDILERLRTKLGEKLASFVLHERIQVPLYFKLSDTKQDMLRIDFPRRAVEFVREIKETDYYSVATPSWQIATVLDGTITWEEFALTFRMRLNRKPDVYQTLIQGFLLMEPEDMNWFCGGLLEIERRRERIVVEAGGTRYSMDRYCPHQGADLTQGWLDQGRLWTCPRHRWQFALDKGGQCTASKGSVHAVCLEGE
jgi:UDP-MurNAc hydroxylase